MKISIWICLFFEGSPSLWKKGVSRGKQPILGGGVPKEDTHFCVTKVVAIPMTTLSPNTDSFSIAESGIETLCRQQNARAAMHGETAFAGGWCVCVCLCVCWPGFMLLCSIVACCPCSASLCFTLKRCFHCSTNAVWLAWQLGTRACPSTDTCAMFTLFGPSTRSAVRATHAAQPLVMDACQVSPAGFPKY